MGEGEDEEAFGSTGGAPDEIEEESKSSLGDLHDINETGGLESGRAMPRPQVLSRQNTMQATQEARRLRMAEEQRRRQVEGLQGEIASLKRKMQAKDEAIHRLEEELLDQKEIVRVQNDQIKQLEAAMSKKGSTTSEVEEQLRQSEEEFDQLSEALREKDIEVSKLKERITALESSNDSLEKEVLRQKTILHGKGIGTKRVETEEVCLSARSFSENELISLRDEAIAVKERQIAIINESNSRLRDNIDHVENEVEKLQFDMIRKDKEINKLRGEKQEALDRIVELERQVEVKEGKDEAMEVATRQNAQLLMLLQQQEKLSADLEDQNRELSEELEDLKRKQKVTMTRCAEFEVQATTERQQVFALKKELLTIKSTWETEEKTLRHRLEKLERESTETIEAQREELRSRREKHYEMLAKLQASEAAVREAEDKVYQMQTQVQQIEARNKELDLRHFELQRWGETQEQRHQDELTAMLGHVKEAKKEVRVLERQKSALSQQLHELSGTVIKAVDKQKNAIEQAVEAKSAMEKKQNQFEQLKKRMVKEGNMQGKRRMRVELEQRVLSEQLDTLREENIQLAQATNANFEEQIRENEELRRKCEHLEHQVSQAKLAQENRFKQLLRFVDASCFIFENDEYVLHLEGCMIGSPHFSQDQAMTAVMQLAKHLALMLSESNAQDAPLLVNLSDNALNDSHIHAAVGKIVQAPFRAKSVTVDLSRNHFSPEGIRALVLSLGKNRMIQHVYVHRDGTVQGLRGSDVVYSILVNENYPTPGTHCDSEPQVDGHEKDVKKGSAKKLPSLN